MTFIRFFQNAPENQKRELLKKSLFPKGSKHSSTPHHTRPLNYLIFTGHIKALEAIETYLKDEDWLCRGPYESTFVHCLIAGMEKTVTKRGDPLACLHLLLKKFPSLAWKVNEMGTKPKTYLEVVLPKLRRNLVHVEKTGREKKWEFGTWISVRDCKEKPYWESYDEIKDTIEAGEKMLGLL